MLPKDILNLCYIAKSLDLHEVAEYWRQVIKINDYQKYRFAKKIISSLFSTVSDKKITLLGWAFKKDTNDSRESAAIYIADYLIDNGAKLAFTIQWLASKNARRFKFHNTRSYEDNKKALSISKTLFKLKKSYAIAVITEWDEFKFYDWQQIFNDVIKPVKVFDGRNILDKNMLQE